MNVVIDTNILISAILNVNSSFNEIIFDYTKTNIKYYTPLLSTHEILSHKEKIIKITKYNEQEFNYLHQNIIKYINVVNCDFLPIQILKKAKDLVKNVDIKDEDFVSLAIFTNGFLWTGDKKLTEGLKAKGFKKVVNTQQLIEKISKL